MALALLGAKPNVGTGFFDPRPPFGDKNGWLIWCAASEDPAAEEARLAVALPQYANFKKEYDISRRTITRTSEYTGSGEGGEAWRLAEV